MSLPGAISIATDLHNHGQIYAIAEPKQPSGYTIYHRDGQDWTTVHDQSAIEISTGSNTTLFIMQENGLVMRGT